MTKEPRSGGGPLLSQMEVKNIGRGIARRVQKSHQGNIPRTTEWRGASDGYSKTPQGARETAYSNLEKRKKSIPRSAVDEFEQHEGLSPSRIDTLVQQNRIVFRGGKLIDVG